MTASTDSNPSVKVPLFSNAAAGGLTGLFAVSVTAWTGHIPFFESDFSYLKAFAFFMLPSMGMYISHAIKSIGYKWSLGTLNRDLLRLNRKKQKELKKDIKKFRGVVSEDKINDLIRQLERAVQDKHDIISNNYERLIAQRNTVQSGYKTHKETQPNDNSELHEIINRQREQQNN